MAKDERIQKDDQITGNLVFGSKIDPSITDKVPKGNPSLTSYSGTPDNELVWQVALWDFYDRGDPQFLHSMLLNEAQFPMTKLVREAFARLINGDDWEPRGIAVLRRPRHPEMWSQSKHRKSRHHREIAIEAYKMIKIDGHSVKDACDILAKTHNISSETVEKNIWHGAQGRQVRRFYDLANRQKPLLES